MVLRPHLASIMLILQSGVGKIESRRREQSGCPPPKHHTRCNGMTGKGYPSTGNQRSSARLPSDVASE